MLLCQGDWARCAQGESGRGLRPCKSHSSLGTRGLLGSPSHQPPLTAGQPAVLAPPPPAPPPPSFGWPYLTTDAVLGHAKHIPGILVRRSVLTAQVLIVT